MNRPVVLQFLRKGVLLLGSHFPRFVDTWNWLVSAFDTMVGDADLNPEQGHIKVDRTDSSRPILRLVNTNKLGSGEGGGDGTIEVQGSSGKTVKAKKVIFTNEENSNLVFDVSETSDGVATITVSVRYL